MPRSLAAGKTKVAVCVTEPADPAAPTATELNAAIQASPSILDSDFAFGATDSEKVNEKALSEDNNANAIGAGNYSAGWSIFRLFDATTGAPDTANEDLWEAMKAKGTTLWVYARETGKESDAAWAATDEIYLGAEVVTDSPQPPQDRGGFTKRRVPMEVQRAWDNIEVAAP